MVFLKGRGLFLSFLTICFIFIFSHLVFAQNVPSAAKAGVVERDLKDTGKKPAKAKQEPVMEIEFPKEELAAKEGQKFLVKSFKFRGNTVLKKAYLKRFVKKYRNKELSIVDLKKACNKITKAYRDRGFFLAKAYLPAQEIKDNTVTIEIIEGALGKVKIEGAKFYNKKFIRRHFRCTQGGIVNYDRILKSLLILNEYPKLDIQATLQQGQKPYTVDVVLKVQDKLPLTLQSDYNNHGSRYVSRHRIGSAVDYSNIFWAGDKLYVRGVSGTPERTVKFGYGEYSFPINGYGTRAQFSYTWSDFDVQREYRILDAGGMSRIWTFQLEHPLVKSRLSNLDFMFGFDYKDIRNYLLSTLSSRDELRVFKAGFSGDHIDSFNGRNYFNVIGSGGLTGIMGSSRANDRMASRTGAGGNFSKANLDLARYQSLIWNNFALLKISGQAASDTLPISEEMSIGGADSVRGYPQSEFLGDYGFYTTCEWRFGIPFLGNRKIPFTNKTFKQTVQLLGFIDYGLAYIKNRTAGEAKNYDLAAYGPGARINFGDNLSARIDWGIPLNERKPSDGKGTKLYIQVVAKF